MSEKRLSLFVFIDAAGWEIVRRRRFLEDLLPERAPLQTVFGYSSTCDPTILTGKMPREHGHFSFFRYDPAASPFRPFRRIGLLPRWITESARVRRHMSRLIARSLGYTGYFQIYHVPFAHLPLFDYTEKRDLYRPGGINSGAPTIFDFLRERKIPFHLSDWRRGEEENLRSLETALGEGKIAFAYLYMAALDAVLHALGTRARAVAEKLAWYEERIAHIVETAEKNYDTVRLFLFSDHGMTDCVEDLDLMGRIDDLGLAFGRDYAAVYDSTMARFWFIRYPARRLITRALENEPRGRILSDGDLAAYGCDFPDKRYGELFFLLNPGVLLCPSFMARRHLAAMHGYAPEHEDSVAAFLSNVRPDPLPRRLDDLHGLMVREALGGGKRDDEITTCPERTEETHTLCGLVP